MKRIFSLLCICLAQAALIGISAVPARRDPFVVTQPNGDSLTIRLVGDERWHANYTADGYLIKQGEDGWWYYAKWQKNTDPNARKVAVPTRKKAQDADKRSACRKRWIKRHIPNPSNEQR